MTQRDWFAEAFGRAVTDIREKLVEEPWFGRRLARPGEHGRSSADNAPTQGDKTSDKDIHGNDHDRDDPGQGIDR